MKTDDRNNPLFPDFEADKCLYFRRNHDILLGPLSALLYHASYIGHYICRMDYHTKSLLGGYAASPKKPGKNF